MTPLALNPSPASEPTSASAAAPRSCLSFRLGEQAYGIDLLKVQEIRNFTEPTRMAGAPPSVRGVIDLRGTVVPIVDLRVQFGLPEAPVDGNTVVIMLNLMHRVVGIVVDAVNEVIDIAPGQLRPAPVFSALVNADHIVGLLPLPGSAQAEPSAPEQLLIVTDIERLMGGGAMELPK